MSCDTDDAVGLNAMSRDAARYEFLREFWLRLIIHTATPQDGRCAYVTSVEIGDSVVGFDPQTLDHAIDAALERQYMQEAIRRGENDG